MPRGQDLGRSGQEGSLIGLTVVYGPQCGGKTTYVDQHRRTGDLVLDYDRVYQALTACPPHTYGPDNLRSYALAAMNSALKEWRRRSNGEDCWLIRTYLSEADLPATVVLIDPGRETCLERAKDRPDPVATVRSIERWYSTQGARTGAG